MIDLKLIRENPDLVRESQKKRGADVSVVDEILVLDKKWRELKSESDKLRSERNKISQEINETKKNKNEKKAKELLNLAKEIPEKMKKVEEKMKKVDEERMSTLQNIPNLIHESSPIGDATKNKVIEEHGKIKKPKFKLKGHEEILNNLNLLDTEKASRVAGSRFYYLKGDLVKLNYALINFAMDFLSSKGFTLVQPPYMLNRKALSGAITLGAFEEMIYKIDNEDLYLIGTAEHALNAYHMEEDLNATSLPIRLAGISPCFRKEAGAHGKDTKGIFRIHQFEKIEQFIFCKPEKSWEEFEFILNNSREMLKQLEIPFRFVILSTEDTGRVPTKTIDFEGWFPVQEGYRELGSCSNCTDYQARRSSIRYKEKGELRFVHTLNNTAIATERMLACLVENNQQEDGSIKIPEVLWKYTGFKEIKAKK